MFEFIHDRVYMRISSEQDLPFEIHQVTVDKIKSKSSEIYARDRVSLLGSPIVRFALIKASPTRYRLIIRLSHAQYDGFCAHTFGQHLRFLNQSRAHCHSTNTPGEYKTHASPTAQRFTGLKGCRMPKLVRRSKCGPPFDKTLNGEFRRSVVEPNLRCHGLSTATIVKAAWTHNLLVVVVSRCRLR